MERLTGSKTAATLKENAEKLQAAGFAVDMSNLRYIRLAEYEETGLTVDDILYILADRKNLSKNLNARTTALEN